MLATSGPCDVCGAAVRRRRWRWNRTSCSSTCGGRPAYGVCSELKAQIRLVERPIRPFSSTLASSAMTTFTGTLYHAIRFGNGGWTGLGDVKRQAGQIGATTRVTVTDFVG